MSIIFGFIGTNRVMNSQSGPHIRQSPSFPILTPRVFVDEEILGQYHGLVISNDLSSKSRLDPVCLSVLGVGNLFSLPDCALPYVRHPFHASFIQRVRVLDKQSRPKHRRRPEGLYCVLMWHRVFEVLPAGKPLQGPYQRGRS